MVNKFSVSMCVYHGDNAEWFMVAVDSVVHQTLPPDEIVIVVDGPVPEKLDQLIKSLEEIQLFKIVRLETNRGHGEARRIGLEMCSYEIVAIMDADDVSVLDRFERQILELEVSNADIVGGMISEFVGDISFTVGRRIVPLSDFEIKEYLKKRCPMNLTTVMFKKTSIEKVGGFIDWYCEEDYYLWVRCALANLRFANVNNILVYVRVGEDMYLRRGGTKYFKSEAKLQKYMWEHRVISFWTYLKNVIIRFVVQILLPNKLRGWVFRKFARA